VKHPQGIDALLRSGRRIRVEKSAYQQRTAFEEWRAQARALITSGRLPLKLDLKFDSFDTDFQKLSLFAIRHRKRKRQRTSVYVVFGRDRALRSDMLILLRSLGLQPIEWSSAVLMAKKGTPLIYEVLVQAFRSAQAVIILFSGDDEVRLRKSLRNTSDDGGELEFTPQPRPNVILEAGMALGREPRRTIIVSFGRIRRISDLAGHYLLKMDGSTESRTEFVERLRNAGCDVDTSGTEWSHLRLFTQFNNSANTPNRSDEKRTSESYRSPRRRRKTR
jgi:predicted nucleotide-binding protein